MLIHQNTRAAVAQIQEFSNNRLRLPETLELLIELRDIAHREREFQELIFSAKALKNLSAIIKRIKPDAEGYDKLANEFQSQLDRVRAELESLVAAAPVEVASRFRESFLTASQESLNQLFDLIQDLSWVKNFVIDTKQLV
ncbi:MAG: hypothetical protein ACP5JH_07065 [Bacteroidota bacterium]